MSSEQAPQELPAPETTSAAPLAAEQSSPDQPKIILYWLEKSRAQRIVWLLEETKLPYEIKTYKRVNRLAPPELKEVHPLGKSPVITIQAPGQAEPITLAESGLICEYLTDHFAPHLKPTQWKQGQEGKVGGETESWLRYRYYMHYAEGSLMLNLVLRYIIGALAGPDVPVFIRPLTRAIVGKMNSAFLDPNIKTHLGFLESQLASSPGGGPYLCGPELTSADILMSFPLISLVASGSDFFDLSEYPKIKAYERVLQSNPTMQGTISKVEGVTGEKYKPF